MTDSRFVRNSQPEQEPGGDIVDAALQQLRGELPAPAKPPASLVAAVRSAMASSERQLNQTPSRSARPNAAQTDEFSLRAAGQPQRNDPKSHRRSLMRTFSTTLGLLATAAVVLVAATLLEQPNAAFADLVQKIRDAKMVSFRRMLVTESTPDGIPIKEHATVDGRRRTEQSGTITVFRADGSIAFTLLKGTRTVLPGREPLAVRSFKSSTVFTTFEELKSREGDPDEDLGERVIDGRRSHGFIVRRTTADLTQEITLWVDASTGDIVRMVDDREYQGRRTTTTLTNIVLHKAVDEPLFEVPTGYKEYAKPAVPLGEQRTIDALRGFARYNDGVFPDSLTDMSIWLEKFQAEETGGFGNRDSNSVMRAINQTVYLLSRTAPGEYGYLGAGVVAGDPTQLIFWYASEDGPLRGIFGDYSSRTIEETEIPSEPSR